MRKKKIDSRYVPYLAGMAAGCATTLLVSIASAVVLSFSDSAGRSAGAASVIALSLGSFVCGRIAGMLRHRDGMRTGALCGLIFSAVPLILSVVFGQFGSIMVLIKPLLCVFFGTAGGVAGVNSTDS